MSVVPPPLRVLVMMTRSETSVETRIMDNIVGAPATARVAYDVFRPRSLVDLRFFGRLARSDIVLVHTPLLLTFVYALIARYWHRKPIVAVAWDSYPVTLGGVRYDKRLRRRILDRIENIVVALCDRILVPSADFLEERRFAHARVVGLWHPVNPPITEVGSRIADDAVTPLQILFAGQINATRGLAAAVRRIDQLTGGQFHLKVASTNPLPIELVSHPKIEYLGHVDRTILRQVAVGCDCGLVSLARDFDGPGLPSKTFEYLEAGLPCLYYGKWLDHYLRILEKSGAGIDIGADALSVLTREDVLRLKHNIIPAAEVFIAAFELDPPSFIAQLVEANA